MQKHWMKIAVVAVIAVIGAVLFFAPFTADDETTAPPAPDFASVAAVENARLVLPPDAGEPARISFDVRNLAADNTLYITGVAVENSSGAVLGSPERPVTESLAQVPVPPGETVSFGSGESQVVLANYNSEVVPGARVNMRLTFGDADSLVVPMTVEYAGAGTGSADGDAGKAS
ncbi:hypothetical protein [Croceibacterium aestuarii]|uniref:hypothetical protein n=1 Tax=Croceibacterium aestuarii TaxID=3064139 RepID=UPI00272E48DA|nr:hypothetical protein [Croceibacterium sp. D39]